MLLGPLADNGGPTRTRALLPGSAAIDACDPSAFEATDPSGPDSPPRADAREGEITRLIARGLSNRRITAALAVSGRTVEWHGGPPRGRPVIVGCWHVGRQQPTGPAR